MTDQCFASIEERCRYLAQVAKTPVMRNSFTAAADEITTLRAALAECAYTLRIVCSVWPARFNEFSTSDGGKLVSVNPQATLDAALALSTKDKEPQPAAKDR